MMSNYRRYYADVVNLRCGDKYDIVLLRLEKGSMKKECK